VVSSKTLSEYYNLIIAAFLVGLSTIMVMYLVDIDAENYVREWLTLPLIVTFSIVLFLGALSISTMVLHKLNLTSKSQALGLPPGSIRALIALSLIIIFAIMVIYMQSELEPTRVSYDGGNTYEYREPSEAQKNFALQSLTTIGTLVTSLAAFYFGTAAVETARGAGAPAIVITPQSVVEMDLREQQVLYPIKIDTTPKNEAIEWSIDTPEHGSIIPIKPNEFKYKIPKEKSLPDGTLVNLNFVLVKYPNVSEQLRIKITNPPKSEPAKSEPAKTEPAKTEPAKTEKKKTKNKE
jgi:hypothetical protein